MNASTAGGSAASGCTVGGSIVNIGGQCGHGLPRARMPSWQRDPLLEQDHDSQVAMVATPAPPLVAVAQP